MECGQVVVAHRQVLLGQDEEAGTQWGGWGVYGVSTCHHDSAPFRGPSATQAQSTSTARSRTHPASPSASSAHACQHRSLSSPLDCSVHLPQPPRYPPCPLTAPYQLLQGSQLLWQVTEAGAVQLQPPKTGHGLDILREVASLRNTDGEAGVERNVPALLPSVAPKCPWKPLGAADCVTLDKALCHPVPQFLTIEEGS